MYVFSILSFPRPYLHSTDSVLLSLFVSLQGTKDKTVPAKYSTRIMKLLPKEAKAKLVTVEGAGHDVNISNSEVVTQAISGLLTTPTAKWNEKS